MDGLPSGARGGAARFLQRDEKGVRQKRIPAARAGIPVRSGHGGGGVQNPGRRPQRLSRIAPAHRGQSCSGSSWMLRSEEHTSELQSLMRNSYAVFCLKKKK